MTKSARDERGLMAAGVPNDPTRVLSLETLASLDELEVGASLCNYVNIPSRFYLSIWSSQRPPYSCTNIPPYRFGALSISP